jgi:hypothetical protein
MSGNPTRIAPPKFDQRNEQHTRSSVETRLRSSESLLDNEVRLFKADFTLANGANSNLELPNVARWLRITGPSGAFSVSGFADGYEGKRLILFNPTAFSMTITNDATSTAANRILTLSGADLTLVGQSLAAFIYSVDSLRWILEYAQDGNTYYYAGGTDVAIADGGTGASTALAAFDNLKQSATSSYAGVAELADAAEAAALTSTTTSMTPADTKVAIAAWGHAPDVIVEDQKAQNTAGGTATSGAWRTRDLNTLVRNNGTLASLATNQITLPAGTYFIRWSAPGLYIGVHQTRLRNITDSTTDGVGSSEFNQAGGVVAVQTSSFGSTVITIAGTKVFELQHQVATSFATEGFGRASNFTTEVYARVEITKVA